MLAHLVNRFPPRTNRRLWSGKLALSSCPAAVVGKAALYVLEKSGYVKVRDSQNGFTAIVQHSQLTSQEPQCMEPRARAQFFRAI